ncbi:hypothetical protein H7F37_13640 [Winogradskyella sp. PAMC22761]|nr:hypothetical protein H7F37_13640 [Winogradskyella sp. PAMC22761]
MKKILKITGILVFALTLTLSTSGIVNAQDIKPVVIIKGDVPINIGTRGCVCKQDSCIDQNVVSFRKSCGHRGGGSASGSGADTGCSLIGKC